MNEVCDVCVVVFVPCSSMVYSCPCSAMTGKISFSMDVGLSCEYTHTKNSVSTPRYSYTFTSYSSEKVCVCVTWILLSMLGLKM